MNKIYTLNQSYFYQREKTSRGLEEVEKFMILRKNPQNLSS